MGRRTIRLRLFTLDSTLVTASYCGSGIGGVGNGAGAGPGVTTGGVGTAGVAGPAGGTIGVRPGLEITARLGTVPVKRNAM